MERERERCSKQADTDVKREKIEVYRQNYEYFNPINHISKVYLYISLSRDRERKIKTNGKRKRQNTQDERKKFMRLGLQSPNYRNVTKTSYSFRRKECRPLRPLGSRDIGGGGAT